MQPLKSIATQWEAKDKKLRPRNPKPAFNYEFPPDGPSESQLASAEADFDIRISEWNKRQETAKVHTFDTDLPDRIYNADELNEPVYEGLYGTLWVRIDSETYKQFVLYPGAKWQLSAVRQFVTLKQTENEKVIINCLHATCPACGANVDVTPAAGTYIDKQPTQQNAPLINEGGETVEK